MATDGITHDELRAMFGDALPLEAYAVLHPPVLGGKPSKAPVAEVRAALVGIALERRETPLRLSGESEAELYAMAKLLGCVTGRPPYDRAMADEQFLYMARNRKVLDFWLAEARDKIGLLRDFRVEMSGYLAGRRDDDLSTAGLPLDERSREDVVQLVSDMLAEACDSECEVDDERDALGADLVTLTCPRLSGPFVVRLSFTGEDGAFGAEWPEGGLMVQRERHLPVMERRIGERLEAMMAPAAPGPR